MNDRIQQDLVNRQIRVEDDEDEERNLVQHLRNELCHPNGKEKNPKISAEIFHKLGQIYMKRSPDKICLIQSAALFNAALARNPENVDTIKRNLFEFCSQLLERANAVNKNADLVAQSNIVKQKLCKLREKTTQQMEKLKIIPDEEEDEKKLHILEKLKIAFIQRLQDNIAKDYKSIMKDISEYCIDVMGQPPCEFTLVGMGSLARSEITPYSDFENIIVLEEEVKTKGNYEEILEYFRWFAVIFQIILINLQETIIPSVAIPSLNSGTSETTEWYFDAYTTRGVSFDGMMPHACKSPLGRPGTDAKPWKTELIKPVSEMAHYLDVEEDLKNGYHLADLLTKTCFVAGSNLIYDDFYKKVQNKIESQSKEHIKLQLLKEQVSEDLRNFGTREIFTGLIRSEGFNMKKVVYRSTTIFISALGRLNNISSSSCFDIITDLAKKDLIKHDFEHKLKYAVAVACEVRLKVYMKKQGQDDWVMNETTSLSNDSNILLESSFNQSKNESQVLIDAVGEQSIVEYFRIAYCLQYDAAKQLDLDVTGVYSTLATLNLSIYYFLKLYHKVAELSDISIPVSIIIPALANGMADDGNCIGYCFHRLKLEEKHLLDFLHNTKAFQPQTKVDLNRESKENLRLTSAVYTKYGDLLRMTEKFDEAFEHYKRAINLLSSLSQLEDKKKVANLNVHTGLCLYELKREQEAISYFQEAIKIAKKLPTNEMERFIIVFTTTSIATCYANISNFDKAEASFKEAIKLQRQVLRCNDNDRNNLSLLMICDNFGTYFLKRENYKRCLKYLSKSLKIYPKLSLPFSYIESKITLLKSIGFLLLDLKQFEEALQYFLHLESLQQGLSPGNSDPSLVLIYYKISQCLNNLGRKDESISYASNAFEIYKELSLNADNNEKWIKDYLECVYLLIFMQSFDEALKCVDRVLNIFHKRKISKDHTDFIVKLYLMKGNIFMLLIRYKKSQRCFLKAIELQREISSDENKDVCLAICCSCFSYCLKRSELNEEALKYIHLAFDIFENLRSSSNQERNVATTFAIKASILTQLKKFMRSQNHLQDVNNAASLLILLHEISSDKTCDEHIALTSIFYGECLIKMQQPEEALKHLQTALSISKKVSLKEDYDYTIAQCKLLIGEALIHSNKCDDALSYLETSLDIAQKSGKYKLDRVNSCKIHKFMAICLADAGNCEESLEEYRKCSNFTSTYVMLATVRCEIVEHFLEIASGFMRLNKYTETLNKSKLGLEMCKLLEKFPEKQKLKTGLTKLMESSLEILNQHQ